MNDEKIVCETPTPGKNSTRIDKWKYEAVRKAILKVVPTEGPGILFKELPQYLEGVLTDEELENLGSLMWYTTTVKLDMEAKGELIRLKGSPQRLIRS
ncbi:DUF6958 family protein [Balneola vulgaris]|uniref:DUF6958 family protein n=1 Tax=Balneola vulgaris TaxID=287535 RepID=UPI000373418D|nr:hypothetical protein [Balneola vulgaris]